MVPLLTTVVLATTTQSTAPLDGWTGGYACQSAATRAMPFCDRSLATEARVKDLVSRLTTDEKASLMGAHGKDICAFQDGGVPRLDIPSYTWCTEDNSGVSTVCLEEGKCVTTWPSPALLAATFNRTLWRAKGHTQGIEHRAMYNLGGKRGSQFHPHIGLNGWGPNINVIRDPRYGRNSELPSEDPLLNGFYAVEVVKGQQTGDDPEWPLLIHSTLKHYTAYSVETNRFGFNGNVSKYDLYDSFTPQYKMGFMMGGAGGAMCSYASMNGIPSCANELILNNLVRNEWKQPEALIVTDCEAVQNMYRNNHYAKNDADATAKSINSGVDLNTGYPWFQNNGLIDALGNKTINISTVNTALSRSLLWKFRLGLFDNPLDQTYTKLDLDDINTTNSQQLVQEAASQGFVMLRNKDNLLPLKSGAKVAVVGPHANSTTGLLSDYYGDEVCYGQAPSSDPHTAGQCIHTIGSSIKSINTNGETRVEPGCSIDATAPDNGTAALDAAKWADVIVLCIGLDHAQEHEGIDRSAPGLPPAQAMFVQAIMNSVGNKPIVTVMVNGGVLAADNVLGPDGTDAVVEAFYPNQAGAQALGPALFGKTNNWGKLPYTIYPESYYTKLTIEEMRMRADKTKGYPGRGYRYYNGKPVFQFGEGLSYTSFRTNCTMNGSPSTEINLMCEVSNIGTMDGDEIVILFHKPPASPSLPARRLIEFERVTVGAASKVAVQFTILPDQLYLTDEEGSPTKISGSHAFEIGLDGQEIQFDM